MTGTAMDRLRESLNILECEHENAIEKLVVALAALKWFRENAAVLNLQSPTVPLSVLNAEGRVRSLLDRLGKLPKEP